MRVMVIVKASKESEAGQMPSEQLLRDMGNFNEQLVNAGIMLAGDGLHPTSKGKRVKFSGANRTVIDGILRRNVQIRVTQRLKIVRIALDDEAVEAHTFANHWMWEN